MLPTFLKKSKVKGQGQGHEGLKNCWTELHEIFSDDLSSSKDQSIRFWSDQVKGEGQGHKTVKNYLTELHEISRDNLSLSKDHLIRFWEQLGQTSRSRLRKG